MAHPDAPPRFPAEQIWDKLDPLPLSPVPWEVFRHREQTAFLHQLKKQSRVPLVLEAPGVSNEEQALYTLRFGRGKRRVLVWARQHGDESDCTAGLMMALDMILKETEPWIDHLLDELDFLVFPMVNPDGVERSTRRNALGIDLNRDAVAQATSEGRLLKSLNDEFQPEICFNLHDMSARKSNEEDELVAMAFQACPFDTEEADDEPRTKAKRIVCAMAELVKQHDAGVARYTADFMPKAFGDNMARWGAASVLLEAGGWYEEKGGNDYVRRLFALAFLRGLHATATGEADSRDHSAYEQIPFDKGKPFFDVVIDGPMILNGAGRPVFRADVALNRDARIDHRTAEVDWTSTVEALGDLELENAKARIPASEHLLMPGLIGISPGADFADGALHPAEFSRYIQAGVTTLIHGAGPFASNRARAEWLAKGKEIPPPINLMPFERVGSIRELFSRHGMSELAGLLVQDREIAAVDLLHLQHLFHPAEPMARAEDLADRTVAADLFFAGAPSRRDVRLHLHLAPAGNRHGLVPARSEELRQLVDDFLVDPDQVAFSIDAADPAIDWLPLIAGYGGLSLGRDPGPDFLGSILLRGQAKDLRGVMAVHNRISLIGGRAFRLVQRSRIEIGSPADFALFPLGAVERLEDYSSNRPAMVIVNGAKVLQDGEILDGPPAGHWLLAPECLYGPA